MTRSRVGELINRKLPCRDKARYKTAEKAEAVAHQRRRADPEVEAYPCEPCGGWHVGARRGA